MFKWQIKKLGEIGIIFNGNSINERVKKEKYLGLEGGLPFIATKDIDFETHLIDYENGVQIPFSENGFKIAHKNSILVCAEGGSAWKKVAFNEKDICFGNKLFALETKTGIYPKFVYYWYLTDDFANNFKNLMNGLIWGVSMNNFKALQIPIPPLPEQLRIVEILDQVFVQIEEARGNTEKNLENAKGVFEAYLENIFANQWEDWEEKKLWDIYDVRDGTHDSPKYQKEWYALITSKNLKKGELDYRSIKYISEKDYQKINDRSRVHKWDILFAMIGTIWNPVVVEIDPNFAIKNVALFKIPESQNNYFLKYFLDSKFVIDKMIVEAKGTTQQFVGLGYLRNFKVWLPPLLEQHRIVSALNTLSTETKRLESIYTQKLALLDELRRSILQKAFNGEL